MRRLGLCLATIAVAWCAGAEPPAPPATADLSKLSIEELMDVEVVYGASRYAQRASEAPASVTIVSAADIRQYGYRTLADVLRSVQGFSITYDRNYAYVGVRGFGRPGDYNTRVLVLVDGHRLNDNVYDEALVENGFVVDLDLVDRIEVVRGPNFSVYGTSAFFPVVVNVITRRPPEAGPEVSLDAASFGTYGGRVAYGSRSAGGLDVVASASLLDSRGQDLFFRQFDSPETNNGIAVHADDERAYRLFARATYGGVTVEAAHSMREKGIPTASFGSAFNDRRERTWDERSFLDVRTERRLGRALTLFGRAYYDRTHYRGDYPTDYPPVILNRDIGAGEWWGAEAFALYSGLERHTFIVGAEYQDDVRQEQRNFDVSPPLSYLDVRGSGRRWAAFAQDEFRAGAHVVLSLGLRHDRLAGIGGKDSPRVAVIYNPGPVASVKLLYGRAFRPANQYEMFYATDYPAQLPNPELEPETIETWELVVDHAVGRDLRATGSIFYYHIDDLITYSTDPVSGAQQYRNAGEIESKGFELALSGRLAAWATGRFSYSFQDTRDLSFRAPLTNSPRHLLKANLAVPLTASGVSAGLEAQYTSPRLTVAGNQTGGFTVMNLTVLVPRVVPGLDLSLSAYNLLDKRYADPGSERYMDAIVQDGRSLAVKLRWGF